MNSSNYSIETSEEKFGNLQLLDPPLKDEFYDYSDCQYAIKHIDHVAGAWTYMDRSIVQVGVIDYGMVPEEGTTTLSTEYLILEDNPGYEVADICDSKSNNDRSSFLFFVLNSSSSNANLAYCTFFKWGDSFPPNTKSVRWDLKYSYKPWCCASNAISRIGAVGDEFFYYLIEFESQRMQEYRHKMGVPYALEFNSDGNYLYCGLQYGRIAGIDLRSSNHNFMTHMSVGSSVQNLKLLSNQRNVIVSGDHGLLQNIDIRMNQLVFEYSGHQSVSRKLPFTCDEGLGLITSTGEDNVVRIWSLNHGKLLHSLSSPGEDFTQQIYSFLVSKGQNIFLHSVLNNTIYTHYLQNFL